VRGRGACFARCSNASGEGTTKSTAPGAIVKVRGWLVSFTLLAFTRQLYFPGASAWSHRTQFLDVVRVSTLPSGNVSVTVYVFCPFWGGHVISGGLCMTVEQSVGRTGASVASERTRMSDFAAQGSAA